MDVRAYRCCGRVCWTPAEGTTAPSRRQQPQTRFTRIAEEPLLRADHHLLRDKQDSEDPSIGLRLGWPLIGGYFACLRANRRRGGVEHADRLRDLLPPTSRGGHPRRIGCVRVSYEGKD